MYFKLEERKPRNWNMLTRSERRKARLIANCYYAAGNSHSVSLAKAIAIELQCREQDEAAGE